MIVAKLCEHQDEYYTPSYAIIPLVEFIPEGKTIWCPFDTEESNYVKVFNRTNKVIATHIKEGFDFFEICDEYSKQCDFIISNPPYTRKGEVLHKLFELGKPFAMLVGVVGLFESKYRFEMFRDNNFEIMYFDKRVSYFKDYKEQKPSLSPPFSSVYICSGVLPKQIMFRKINKNLNNYTL